MEHSAEHRRQSSRIKPEYIIAAVAIALTIAAAVIVIRYSGVIRSAGAYGYAGLIIINILAGATAIVPIPALALVFTMGGVLNPALVGLSAGLGEAIGALGIYFMGMGGRNIFQSRFPKAYPRVVGWVQRRGPLAVFLYSSILNPFFYPLTLAAGALRFALWKFFLACFSGKTIKGTAVAYAGYFGLRWLLG